MAGERDEAEAEAPFRGGEYEPLAVMPSQACEPWFKLQPDPELHYAHHITEFCILNHAMLNSLSETIRWKDVIKPHKRTLMNHIDEPTTFQHAELISFPSCITISRNSSANN